MKRLMAFVVICTMFAIPASGLAAALGNVSHSFSVASGVSIVAGNVVSLNGSGGQVSLADTDNAAQLVGVATTANQSLVAIASQSAQQQVQVVTEGTANAYVSTIAGDIHAGDRVAVSPLRGIGMEAGSSTLRTIGVAQADFTTTSSGAVLKNVTDKSGNSKQIYIGVIPVLVSIGVGQGAAGQGGVAGQLQSIAQALIGHQVSVTQAVLGFVELLIALSALIALIYGAIHGGIVAIGRNPLARTSIYTSLMQVLGMASLIVLVAVAIVYFTLR